MALCLEKLAGVAGRGDSQSGPARLLGAAEVLRQASQSPMGALTAPTMNDSSLRHARGWTTSPLPQPGQKGAR